MSPLHRLLAVLVLLACACAPEGEQALGMDTGGALACPEAEASEDPDCFQLVAQATGEEELVYDLAWSPTEPLLLTGSTGLLRLWSLDEEAGKLVLLDALSEPARFNSVVWTADPGLVLAPSGATLRLVAVDSEAGSLEELTRSEEGPAELQRVSLAASGAHALTCDQAGNLLLYEVDLAAPAIHLRATLPVHSRCTRVALSPDGTRALSVGHDGLLALTAVDPEAVEPAEALVLLDTLQGPEETGEAIWHPDGVHVTAGTFGEANELWEVVAEDDSLELLHRRCDHHSGIGALELSHDDTRLLSGAHDDVLHLYDLSPGTEALTARVTAPDDGMGVHSARWSPDDHLVARTASNVDRLFVYRVGACGQP